MSHSTLCSSRRLGRAIPVWAAAAATLFGCSVYDSRYLYEPRPVDVQTTKPGADDAEPTRTLVTVVGVRREDSKSKLPASVEVRLRVENTSPFPVAFDPASFVLFSAGLERFPDPIVQPEGPFTVAPAGTAVVKAFFPFPEGRGHDEFDLSGLNLRWTIEVDGHAVTSSAGFLALPSAYYDRYHHRIGVGYQRYDMY
jgi:hypothetical protein